MITLPNMTSLIQYKVREQILPSQGTGASIIKTVYWLDYISRSSSFAFNVHVPAKAEGTRNTCLKLVAVVLFLTITIYLLLSDNLILLAFCGFKPPVSKPVQFGRVLNHFRSTYNFILFVAAIKVL